MHHATVARLREEDIKLKPEVEKFFEEASRDDEPRELDGSDMRVSTYTPRVKMTHI